MATQPAPTSLFDTITDIDRRLKTQETSNRLQYASIPSGGQVVGLNPSGNVSTRIGTFTGSTQSGIRIQDSNGAAILHAADSGSNAEFGVPQTGVWGTWNKILITNDQQMYFASSYYQFSYGGGGGGNSFQQFAVLSASSRGATGTSWSGFSRLTIDDNNGFRASTGGSGQAFLRMNLDQSNGIQLWDTDGSTIRMWAKPYNDMYLYSYGQAKVQLLGDAVRFFPSNDGNEYCQFWHAGAFNASVRLRMVTPDGYGMLLKYYLDLPAANNQRIEIRNSADTGFEPLWAASFIVNSDRAAKNSIDDLGFSALDKLRPIQPRRFKRTRDDNIAEQEEIGLVTDEAPSEVVSGDAEASASGINIYALLTLAVASIQELERRLEALEKGGKK